MRKKTTLKKPTRKKTTAKKTSVRKTQLKASPAPKKKAVSKPKTDESFISKIMGVVDDTAAKIKTVLPGTA